MGRDAQFGGYRQIGKTVEPGDFKCEKFGPGVGWRLISELLMFFDRKFATWVSFPGAWNAQKLIIFSKGFVEV